MLQNDSTNRRPMKVSSQPGGPRGLQLALWSLPFVVGFLLRSRGLVDQVLIGDERWEISAALARPLPNFFNLRSGARWVVVHREPGAESAQVRGAETARTQRMRFPLAEP